MNFRFSERACLNNNDTVESNRGKQLLSNSVYPPHMCIHTLTCVYQKHVYKYTQEICLWPFHKVWNPVLIPSQISFNGFIFIKLNSKMTMVPFKSKHSVAGEKAHWLRMCTGLAKYQSSTPRTHVRKLQLHGIQCLLHLYSHAHTQAHTHTYNP